MSRLSPAAVLLTAALILTMAAGCAAPSSRSPASREESSPALSQEAPPEEELDPLPLLSLLWEEGRLNAEKIKISST